MSVESINESKDLPPEGQWAAAYGEFLKNHPDFHGNLIKLAIAESKEYQRRHFSDLDDDPSD